MWRLLKHGWSWRLPTRRTIERDDAAVELWKKEVWPRVRAGSFCEEQPWSGTARHSGQPVEPQPTTSSNAL